MSFGLKTFLDAFGSELLALSEMGLLPENCVLDGSSNARSWLHAKVFGALVRAVQRPLVPMIEVKWNKGFCPDLCVVDESDSVVAVVEYESTNSSDERLVGKDLRHFEEAIQAARRDGSPLPPWWIVISTLPNCPVTNWKWWPWNMVTDYPPSVKDVVARNTNPLRYYESGLHETLRQTWDRLAAKSKKPLKMKLVWVNLLGNRPIVMNINGESVSR
jgi:hypothetical protein